MKKILFLFLALSFIYLDSCKKDNSPPPDPPTTGTLSGYVNLYDEGTTEVDNSGMKVSIMDSDPEISVLTDDEGYYKFENLRGTKAIQDHTERSSPIG